MQDRQGKRDLLEAVDDLADHIRALVAEEQAREHLELEVGAQLHMIEVLLHGTEHQLGVALQVLERHAQGEVLEHAQGLDLHRLCGGVVAAVGGLRAGLFVLDVLRGYRRAHEDEVVLEVGALEDLGGDGVEEGFGQLGLVVVHQQPDVVQLDLLPHVHGLFVGAEFLHEPHHAFLDPQVVELDALALCALLAKPVARLEAVFGARRLGAEQPVVPVETVDHGLGDGVGQCRVKALGKHGADGVQPKCRAVTPSTAAR